MPTPSRCAPPRSVPASAKGPITYRVLQGRPRPFAPHTRPAVKSCALLLQVRPALAVPILKPRSQPSWPPALKRRTRLPAAPPTAAPHHLPRGPVPGPCSLHSFTLTPSVLPTHGGPSSLRPLNPLFSLPWTFWPLSSQLQRGPFCGACLDQPKLGRPLSYSHSDLIPRTSGPQSCPFACFHTCSLCPPSPLTSF